MVSQIFKSRALFNRSYARLIVISLPHGDHMVITLSKTDFTFTPNAQHNAKHGNWKKEREKSQIHINITIETESSTLIDQQSKIEINLTWTRPIITST